MKTFAGILIGMTLAVLVMLAIDLTQQVKADHPNYTACDKEADGTAYVIEDNEVVKTFKTEQCEK